MMGEEIGGFEARSEWDRPLVHSDLRPAARRSGRHLPVENDRLGHSSSGSARRRGQRPRPAEHALPMRRRWRNLRESTWRGKRTVWVGHSALNAAAPGKRNFLVFGIAPSKSWPSRWCDWRLRASVWRQATSPRDGAKRLRNRTVNETGIAMKRCAQCHGKLGLGVRSRNVWNGRWWVHVLYCSTHCEALHLTAAAKTDRRRPRQRSPYGT